MYFEIYIDLAKEYRWRLKAGNGKIVADSGEGYVSRYNCERAIASFKAAVGTAPVR